MQENGFRVVIFIITVLVVFFIVSLASIGFSTIFFGKVILTKSNLTKYGSIYKQAEELCVDRKGVNSISYSKVQILIICNNYTTIKIK